MNRICMLSDSYEENKSIESEESEDKEPNEFDDLLDPDFDYIEEKDVPFLQKMQEEQERAQKIIERRQKQDQLSFK